MVSTGGAALMGTARESGPAGTRVWTVQPLEVWTQLERDGSVVVDETRMEYVPPAYQWLQGQMEKRLTGYAGALPWWCYTEKPDLRWVRHWRPFGTAQVRIELTPPAELLLTFPCWAWNTVYCQNYLSYTQEEHDAWMEAMRREVPDEDHWPLPERWRTELEETWLRLFDPDLPAVSWEHPEEGGYMGATRESVVTELRCEDVRGMKSFIGCDRRMR